MTMDAPRPLEKPVCPKCWMRLHQKLDDTKASVQGKRLLEPLDYCPHGVHVRTSIPEECKAQCHDKREWLVSP